MTDNSGVYDSSHYYTENNNNNNISKKKKAKSNYFLLDSNKNKEDVVPTTSAFRLRTSFLNLCNEGNNEIINNKSTLRDDEYAFDVLTDYLGNKFGFQKGSINNQKEHTILLATNFKARYASKLNSNPIYHIEKLHYKLFTNYIQWCEFLNIKPNSFNKMNEIGYKDISPLYMDISLYFLIWGEAANVRHMPECICYLYHQMLNITNTDLRKDYNRSEGSFIDEIIKPIYDRCTGMKQKTKYGTPLEHTKVRNYDDNNEFFWNKVCLYFSPYNVSKGLQNQKKLKTFYEHRSMTSLILNFYRIFQFNIMFFIILIVISFLIAISPSAAKTGFSKFQSIGIVLSPFNNTDKSLAIASIFMSHAWLGLIKCCLEFAHNIPIIFSNIKYDNNIVPSDAHTNTKSMRYVIALFTRFIWNGIFSIIFGILVLFTDKFPSVRTNLLNNYIPIGIIFILPSTLILLVQAFAPSWMTKSTPAKTFIREGETCYTGRNITPDMKYLTQYVMFWILLWLLKAIISFFLLVSPLMLPSLAIYEMKLTYRSTVISLNNIGIIIALWLPVFFIFLYDTQIYFTIFQAIVGAWKGVKMKSGEYHGIQQISKAFRIAPQLFDQKIVTQLARLNDSAAASAAIASKNGDDGTSQAFQSQLMLRFVVVWNEIVNSFREGDLLDDKEAAILQYDIQSTGEVFEPVFLSAGKCGEALTDAIKEAKNNKTTDSELRIFLVQNDCLSAIKSFFNASTIVLETLLSSEDIDVADGLRMIYDIASHGEFMRSFDMHRIFQLRAVIVEFLESVLDLPDPDTPYENGHNQEQVMVHSLGTVRNFVNHMDNLLHCLQAFCRPPELAAKFNASNVAFMNPSKNYSVATFGLLNLFHSDIAMGAATRAYLLLSLEKTEAMPKCSEARRRLGFFMKSLMMQIPQSSSISEMHSFSVMTPYYSETVMFSLDELNKPLDNHPIFQKVEDSGKNITILKYLTTCYPDEWENFLERIDVNNADDALVKYPQEVRLWASYRGQTLARTVQGMMLYEDAIKILHWLEIGSSTVKTSEQKQSQLEDMVRLKFSYICACQVYGKQKSEGKAQAEDIDFLLNTYPNLRVAYVDSVDSKSIKKGNPTDGEDKVTTFYSVLIKSENGEIAEVYRYRLPGDPVLGEGKPENQNNAIPFTRGEFLQTIDMNQQHYFEECLKMPQLLETADLHSSGKPVSIIGMREHIFTGNASSLAKFKTWQELVFVTLSQRVLADPLSVRMHYGHPDIFDKILTLTRGGVSKASKGINLSEDVYAGYNTSLRGGIGTHVEFMQCGKGRDVALSQISMFEAKLANGNGETSLSRESHRMGQFFDFFRLNSMFYSHTGFYFATWLTIVTTFVYMYCKLYIALVGVEEQIVMGINSTTFISENRRYGLDKQLYDDFTQVFNTQFIIQAGLFLTLPLLMVYFTEMGLLRGLAQFFEMVVTLGPAFFVFQVGTTAHYFDNNLLHGGAKYQATGRGFKITRESFVILYKAYTLSHYKKAFELIGLCIIYMTFGNFKICDKTSNTSFGHKFCSASQSFGYQTFAIWFIAVLWLLSPFIFNTDGLDWNKTCVDIIAWSKWMFMKETDEDEDKTNTGGWILWWKTDLDNLRNTKGISRISVILRESRHLILGFYVITVNFSAKAVIYVTGGVLGSLVLFAVFGIIGGILGSPTSSKKAISRAVIYVLVISGITVGYFVVMLTIFKWSQSQCFSLFFGFFCLLYGASEIFRVFNFRSFAIYNSYPVQQLAFFFDFIFGVSMLIPLFVLSGIPFMNVIQTRMMYNEGFSKVMSASSQYAYSLAAYMGLLGGTACGWLVYVLTSLDISPDFISYVSAYNLNVSAGKGFTSYFVLASAAAGSFVCIFLSFIFGRRICISLGGTTTLIGIVVIGGIPDVSGNNTGVALLYSGIGLVGIGVGILMPMIWLYIYEISTKETKMKTILLLCFGVVIGSLCGSYFTLKDKSIGWVWQLFQAGVMVALITPVVNVFPESPSWVLQRQGPEAAQTCLATLRRKQDVSEELNELVENNNTNNRGGQGNSDTAEYVCSMDSMLKFLLSAILSMCTAFSLTPMSNFLSAIPSIDKLFLSQSVGLELVGVFLAFFFIDRITHQAVVLSTFIPLLACIAVMAINETKSFWADAVYTQIFTSFAYLFQGLGIFPICWVNMLGIYTSTKSRTMYTLLSFMIFFFVPLFSLYMKLSMGKSIYYTLYAYATILLLAILSVATLFSCRLSDGSLCTRSQRNAEEQLVRQNRERQNRSGIRTPGSARNKNLSRSRSKSHNKSNYHLYESPAANGKSVRVFA